MKYRYRKNRGFSLVELMIALVIGLIIVMGAGQLFLIGLQNFRQVELLGNKQAALTFAAEMIIRDVRRAKGVDADTQTLDFLAMSNAESCAPTQKVTRKYYVSDSGPVSPSEGWSLMLKQWCGDVIDLDNPDIHEPLATGFGLGGLSIEAGGSDPSDGVYIVTFCLIREPGNPNCEPVTFHAVNRTAAVTG